MDFHGAMLRNTMTPKPNMGSETTNKCFSSGPVVWTTFSYSFPISAKDKTSKHQHKFASADGWKSWHSIEFVQCLGFTWIFLGGALDLFCQRPHWCETGHLFHQPCLYTSNYGNVHWSSSSQVKTKIFLCWCATFLTSEQKERVNVHHRTGNVVISMSQKKKKETSHFLL